MGVGGSRVKRPLLENSSATKGLPSLPRQEPPDPRDDPVHRCDNVRDDRRTEERNENARERFGLSWCAGPCQSKLAFFIAIHVSYSVLRLAIVRLSTMSYSSGGSGYTGGNSGRGRDGDLVDKIKSVNWRGLGRNISNKVKQYAMNLSPLEVQTEEGTLDGSRASVAPSPSPLPL